MQPAVTVDHASRGSLLEELDARQDDVLARLDELNTQLESVLKNWTVRTPLVDAA